MFFAADWDKELVLFCSLILNLWWRNFRLLFWLFFCSIQLAGEVEGGDLRDFIINSLLQTSRLAQMVKDNLVLPAGMVPASATQKDDKETPMETDESEGMVTFYDASKQIPSSQKFIKNVNPKFQYFGEKAMTSQDIRKYQSESTHLILVSACLNAVSILKI